jgi:DNA repair protein RadC
MLLDISRYRKHKIIKSEIAWKILKGIISKMDIFEKEKEHLFVIGLTASNHIKYIDLVSTGSLKGTVAEPREIYRNAVFHGAACIIVGHNHPSNNCTASDSDKRLTERLVSAGKILDITLVDHIIICEKEHFSFANEGLLFS